MMKINEAERDARRKQIFQLVESGLPSLLPIPAPSAIRNARWFRSARLEKILNVYAFPAYQIPLYSGKLFPAFKMLLAEEAAGRLDDCPAIAASSSGNFAKDLAHLAHRCQFNVSKVYAVINKNLSAGKRQHVEFSGAEIVEAPKGIPATNYVYQFATERECLVIDQYIREESITGHEWSMAHIRRAMEMRTHGAGYLFGAVTGTCATVIAGKRYLPGEQNTRVKVFGVASTSKDEKVPGSRTPDDLIELRSIDGFGWQLYANQRKYLDFLLVTGIKKDAVYNLNAERNHENGLQVGPTGALCEAGFYKLLQERAAKGDLQSLKNEEGKIVAVLFWMDSYLAYTGDEYYRSFFGW